MNHDAKQMREFCQRWITKLNDKQNPLDDRKCKETIIAVLKEMHCRLALLEGVEDLRSLENISS